MSLVLFTKSLSDHSVPQLIERGHALGVDGYDLCVRAGHPVQPETVATTLVAAVRDLLAAGLAVPMVTGPFDLLRPDHPAARQPGPQRRPARAPVARLRPGADRRLPRPLSPADRRRGVRHRRGDRGRALAVIGLKDALLVREQRTPGVAQGASLTHRAAAIRWVEAGDGMVDWSAVRATLRRLEFTGPASIHCEYQDPPGGHLAAMQREV